MLNMPSTVISSSGVEDVQSESDALLPRTAAAESIEIVWTWMAGNTTVDKYGVYGTKGVPDAANYPGSRVNPVSWTGADGNLWLFGGSGRAASGLDGALNDLWRHNITSGEWTWMSGSYITNVYGIYGTKGVPDSANYPGSRDAAVSWTDEDGNLWLFGGSGRAASSYGFLNDLWRYNITSGEWTWMSGNNTTDVNGVYGTRGIPNSNNYPGSKSNAASWTAKDGNFWLFGGWGIDAYDIEGVLNDLWRYNLTSGEWTWMKGYDNIETHGGVYGTKGVSNANNFPGSRQGAVSWTAADGNLWLFGGYGYSAFSYGSLNDLWRYNLTSGQWTWMAGNNTDNEYGVYGTKGFPDSTNYPGGRSDLVSWKDEEGNFWLFGGYGRAALGSNGRLNDLWRYNLTSGEWTWLAGDDTINAYGIYGTKGFPDSSNCPGAREGSVSWKDENGSFWLFGGYGRAALGSEGALNDLWKILLDEKPLSNHPADIITYAGGSETINWTLQDDTGGKYYRVVANNSAGDTYTWRDWSTWDYPNTTICGWMAGNDTVNAYGVYGTKGIPHSENYPGSRYRALSWTDEDGSLWLFGGWGYVAPSSIGVLNDLWRYNIISGEWTWMAGNDTINVYGVYGTKGIPNGGDYPGSRYGATYWTDEDGSLWLFGGWGLAASGSNGRLNDLWRYNIISGEWTWMAGNDTVDEYGVYGTKSIPHSENYPGSRDRALSWTDEDGNLWLFGGMGYAASGSLGFLNDLWRYNITSGEWTWMAGNDTDDEYGVYGTKGIPDSDNYPGSRDKALSWTGADGNLWLFGGDDSGGFLNDLWRYNITSGEWTWMAGNDTINVYGVYGTKGIPDSDNYPGGRSMPVSWTDEEGNFWLFGGWGRAAFGSNGRLNDLWRYNIISGEWAWMAGSDNIEEYGIYGTKGVPDSANYPGSRDAAVSWTDEDGNVWLFGGMGYAISGSIGYLNDLWNIQFGQQLHIPINRSVPGTFFYRIEYNDIYGISGISDEVIVTILDQNPTSSHPIPIMTNGYEAETINWTLTDDFGGGKYRIVANNSVGDSYVWVNWTDWTAGEELHISINRTLPGVFWYCIEYNDTYGNNGTPNNITVTIADANPLATQPNDKTIYQSSTEEIKWTLTDDFVGGVYRILANNTAGNTYVWMDWTSWDSGEEISVPINKTSLGVFNYTIIFHDAFGNYGEQDTIIITIESDPIIDDDDDGGGDDDDTGEGNWLSQNWWIFLIIGAIAPALGGLGVMKTRKKNLRNFESMDPAQRKLELEKLQKKTGKATEILDFMKNLGKEVTRGELVRGLKLSLDEADQYLKLLGSQVKYGKSEKVEIKKKAEEVLKKFSEPTLLDLITEMDMDLFTAKKVGKYLTDVGLVSSFYNVPIKKADVGAEDQAIGDALKILRGGDWKIEGKQSVFYYKVKVENTSPLVLNNIQVHLTSIPQGLEMTTDKYQITMLRPSSYESPSFKLIAKESCVGDIIEGFVSYVDPRGKAQTITIEPFEIKYVCNLLTPKRVTNQEYDYNIKKMEKSEVMLDCDMEPDEIEAELSKILENNNFFLLDKTPEPSSSSKRTMKGYAEGKYDHKDVALSASMEQVDEHSTKLVIEAMSERHEKVIDLLRDISLKCDDIKSDTELIKEYSSQIDDIFEKTVDLEAFLKNRLASDWQKLSASWNDYKAGAINRKQFIAQGLKVIGKKFILKLVGKYKF